MTERATDRAPNRAIDVLAGALAAACGDGAVLARR